ncbi:MAG: transcriptional regulator [Candidatus Baldrarchaeia archaeon]
MNEELLKSLARLSKVDKVLSSPTRLAIMILLYLKTAVKFTELQNALGLTPGNLSSHLKKLENVRYIVVKKGFLELRPTTIAKITPEGAIAVRNFMKNMKDVLKMFLEQA